MALLATMLEWEALNQSCHGASGSWPALREGVMPSAVRHPACEVLQYAHHPQSLLELALQPVVFLTYRS